MIRRVYEVNCSHCKHWFTPKLQLIKTAIDLLPRSTVITCTLCGKETEYSSHTTRVIR